MKKRILTILLALVMILSLSTVAFADDGIDTADELKGAITNGNSEIVVTGDITLTEAITISGNVTIKANSAVKITTSAEDALTVTGTLTLGENITIDATESILYANGGTINIEGAALKSSHQTHALGFAANNGTINMKSGSIYSYWTGLTASGTGSVNISGGSVESTNSNAVLAKGGATATVSGGAVKTGEFVTLWAKDSGKLVVTGGTITTGNNAISLESNATANVTGGEFNTLDVLKHLGENANVTVSLTENATLTGVANIAGNVTIKAAAPVTITTSAEDALTVTGTLTLGENITIEATESILYANGGTINVEGAALKSTHQTHALGFAANNGTINMKSGSINSYWTGLTASGTGAVNISGGSVESTNSNAVLAKNGATATVSGGTVKTGEFVTLWAKDSGKLVVTGGTITTGNNAISLESNATANVTGGTFNVDVSAYLSNGYEVKDNGDGTYGVQEKVYPETVSFSATSMVLEENIDIRFWISKDNLDAAGAAYAKVEFNGDSYTVNKADWVDHNDGYYRIPFVDVAAKEMCDEITVTVYDVNGNAVSQTLTYTVGKAIVATHNNTNDAAMKELCVSLLNYGTAAQNAFNYKTNDLASKYLNDLQGQNG